MARRILLVGPAGSGKTTIADAVAQMLGVRSFHLDDFRCRHTPLYVQKDGAAIRSFQHVDVFDGRALAYKLAASPDGWVAEGTILLQYREMKSPLLADAERWYLDVPFAVALERKHTRHKPTPIEESFERIGEHETERWVVPQRDLPGMRVLDGTRPMEEIIAALTAP